MDSVPLKIIPDRLRVGFEACAGQDIYGKVCKQIGDVTIRVDGSSNQVFTAWKSGQLILTTRSKDTLRKFVERLSNLPT